MSEQFSVWERWGSHQERMDAVEKDGRPFWREYYPNFFSGYEEKGFFIDSPEEIEAYLKERQGHPIAICFVRDGHGRECDILSYWCELDKDTGEEVPRKEDPKTHALLQGSCYSVMGFGQNIPEEWFKKFNKDRCEKLETERTKEKWRKLHEQK